MRFVVAVREQSGGCVGFSAVFCCVLLPVQLVLVPVLLKDWEWKEEDGNSRRDNRRSSNQTEALGAWQQTGQMSPRAGRTEPGARIPSPGPHAPWRGHLQQF